MISLTYAPLTLLALLPALVSAVSSRESYAACIDLNKLNTDDLKETTSYAIDGSDAQCSTYCRTRATPYHYAYALDSDGVNEICGCSQNGPTAAMYGTALNPTMICAANQYNAYITLTTFNTPTCYSRFSPTSTNSGRTTAFRVQSHGECFQHCLKYDAASLLPLTDGSGYDCFCDFSNGDVEDNDVATCAPGILARYPDHSMDQTVTEITPAPGASQWVKRRLREQERLESQLPVKHCPANGRACMVAKGGESWECIDTEYELESCGGCVNGEFTMQNQTESAGVDCTALPGVSMGGVSCTHGQCAIWACDPELELKGRECVPIKKSSWKLAF